MIKLSQQRTREVLDIHGWSGILLGLLLYAVICTGTVAVFSDEISDWSSPLAGEAVDSFPPGFNSVFQRLYQDVDPRWREDIDAFVAHGGRIYLRFEGELEQPEAEDGHHEHYGVEYQIDGNTLDVLKRTEGLSEELAAAREAGALAEFFVDLHVRLHLPNPWGLFLTGVLGLGMMVAALTGFVVHRHLIREAFTIRRNKEALLRARDAHVIAGTWSLPFAFVLAFTGSFFSLASSVGLPAMAMVVFAGDQERAVAEVFNRHEAYDASPAPLANIDTLFADAAERGGAEAIFVSMQFAGRKDAVARVFTRAEAGHLSARAFDYAGASGEFIGENPVLVGKAPSAGNAVASLMTPLHFGHFAGWVSKAVWFGLGFAAAYVTLTGMLLWTLRRREQPAWQRMSRLVHWMGYGLPLAMAMTAHAFFWARASALGVELVQWAMFWTTAVVAAVLVASGGTDRARRWMIRLCGLSLLLLPLSRWLCGGMPWPSALAHGQMIIVSLDVALLVAGVLCLRPMLSREVEPGVAAEAAA